MNRNIFKHGMLIILAAFLCGVAVAKDFPVSVKDGSGQTVTIRQKPQRIISLGPAATEILFEVGAENQIAAVSDVSNYPEKAKSLPKIGGFDAKTLNIEKIVSYRPDLIIIYSGMHDFLIPSLKKFRIPYYVSDAKSINDVIAEIKNLAYLTGHRAEGDSLEKKFARVLEDVKKVTVSSGNRPTVFWEIYSSPLMSVGNKSFINDVISASGGINIFSDVAQSYPVVSEETVLASNPKFILLPGDMYSSPDVIKKRHGWDKIDAVKNDRIVIFDADVFTRPGPRIFDALVELNKIFYEK